MSDYLVTAKENVSLKMKRPGGFHFIGLSNSASPIVAHCHYVPQDMLQYEIYDIAYEVLLSKMFNLTLTKP